MKSVNWAGLFVPLLVALALLAGVPSARAQNYSTLRPNSLAVDSGTKTATAIAGAATLSKNSGVITSEALVTAAAGVYTLTITNTTVAATDVVYASVWYGTATTGSPVVTRITPGTGSVVILVQNIHASAALNGTIKVGFLVIKN